MLFPAILLVVANLMTIVRGASEEGGGAMRERNPIPTFNGQTSSKSPTLLLSMTHLNTETILRAQNIETYYDKNQASLPLLL